LDIRSVIGTAALSVIGTAALSGLFLIGSLQAQNTQAAPDNTKANKGDQSTRSTTADKAMKNNLSDREVEAHIRREVVNDKSLSTYAHNVKIVSANGKVTLRGPVRSEQEKDTVEQYAKKYAADQNVINELTVKPKS
jgi:hyperosmotically inducible protein